MSTCSPSLPFIFLFILYIHNTSPLLCLPFTPLFSCLPSLREFSNNRSLDNLDCIGGTGSSLPRWDDDDFSQACSTLGRRSCIGQVGTCRGRDEKSEIWKAESSLLGCNTLFEVNKQTASQLVKINFFLEAPKSPLCIILNLYWPKLTLALCYKWLFIKWHGILELESWQTNWIKSFCYFLTWRRQQCCFNVKLWKCFFWLCR